MNFCTELVLDLTPACPEVLHHARNRYGWIDIRFKLDISRSLCWWIQVPVKEGTHRALGNTRHGRYLGGVVRIPLVVTVDEEGLLGIRLPVLQRMRDIDSFSFLQRLLHASPSALGKFPEPINYVRIRDPVEALLVFDQASTGLSPLSNVHKQKHFGRKQRFVFVLITDFQVKIII